jgi:hypothetical protein
MKRLLLIPLAALMIGFLPDMASASTRWFFGLNLGFPGIGFGYGHGGYRGSSFGFSVAAPFYYAPAPAYYPAYAPAPYYAPAYAPVYVAPAVSYYNYWGYGPRYYWGGRYNYWRGGRNWIGNGGGGRYYYGH